MLIHVDRIEAHQQSNVGNEMTVGRGCHMTAVDVVTVVVEW